MSSNNVILGLHSPRFARALVSTLRAGGVQASIEAASIPEASGGSSQSPSDSESLLVNVCVSAADARRSVALLESNDFMAHYKIELKLAGMSNRLLIPVDLTESSLLACKIGFGLAERLDLSPVVLHVFSVPYIVNSTPDISFPSLDDSMMPAEEAQVAEKLRSFATSQFAQFRNKLDQAIAAGKIPKLNYSTDLAEGVPEEVIMDYTRNTPPALVVMATRDKDKKNSDLIGSVTAEVLDRCRVPVFTVPENNSITTIESIRKLAYFCNLDGQDLYSIEFLMKMFGNPDVEVLLVPVSKGDSVNTGRISELCDYLKDEYPEARFSIANFPAKEFRTELEELITTLGLELLVVPNKKTNIFSRLFSPAIPHRLLFERDVPMLALPV